MVKKANSETANNKKVGGKKVGSKVAGSKNVSGFPVDFILALLLYFIKSNKKHFNIYFLKLY